MIDIDDAVARARAKIEGMAGLDALALVGSVVRGDEMRNSDIDIVALIDDQEPWPAPVRDGGRDVFFDDDGRQVELSYTSVGRVRRRMLEEAAAGRPFRLELVIEARLLAGPGRMLRALHEEANAILEAGPAALDDQERRWRCYEIWNAIKDAEDVLDDEATAVRMAHLAFENLLAFAFQLHGCWLARPKAVLDRLASIDRPLHAMALRFLREAGVKERYLVLVEMKDYLAAVFGLTFEGPYISAPPPRS